MSFIRVSLTFELEPFQNLQVVPLFFFLALDPVEHERAQAQVAHKHGEPNEPPADHVIAQRSGQTIAAPDTTVAVCDLYDGRVRPRMIGGFPWEIAPICMF